MTNDSRLKVGIIGAGPVGTVLGLALAGAGHLLVGINATSPQSKTRAEDLLPNVEQLAIPQILQAADLVLLAIPAQEIEPTVRGYAKAGLLHSGQIVVHTAAKYGTEVLAAATEVGAIALAIHPAMRFTGTSLDLLKIRDAHFAVTASPVAMPIAQALVIEMGGEPLQIDELDRPKYSEAVDVAGSFSALIINQAIGLLNQIGIGSANQILAPLVRSSVELALAEGYKAPNLQELEGN